MKIKRYGLLILLAFWEYITLIYALGIALEIQLLITRDAGFYLPGLIGCILSVGMMVVLLLTFRRYFEPEKDVVKDILKSLEDRTGTLPDPRPTPALGESGDYKKG